MAGRNGTTAAVVDAQVVHDFDALLDEVTANDPLDIVFTLKGVTFTIPMPLKWSDEALRLQSELVAGDDDDERTTNPAAMVAFAQELFGDQYPRYIELGGTAMKFNRVLPRMLGVEVGESSAS
jgi:hypothetical protein